MANMDCASSPRRSPSNLRAGERVTSPSRQHTPDGLSTEVTNAAGETTTASYPFDQRPALLTTSDGVATALRYDDQGNLTAREQSR